MALHEDLTRRVSFNRLLGRGGTAAAFLTPARSSFLVFIHDFEKIAALPQRIWVVPDHLDVLAYEVVFRVVVDLPSLRNSANTRELLCEQVIKRVAGALSKHPTQPGALMPRNSLKHRDQIGLNHSQTRQVALVRSRADELLK